MDAKHDNGHGGKRPGAGRPAGPSDLTIAKGNEIVERKLRSAAADGWEVLAGSYSDLMRRAVSVEPPFDTGKRWHRLPDFKATS